MSSWIVFSIIGHLILLLVLSLLGPQSFLRKSLTPLQQRELAAEKRIVEAQYTKRLSSKVEQMAKARETLLQHRNRRITQYKKLETDMRRRISEQLPADAAELLTIQDNISKNLHAAQAHHDSLLTLQQKVKNDIQTQDVKSATAKLVSAHDHLEQLGRTCVSVCSELQTSVARLDNMRELLAWLNNDSLLIRLDQIKKLQIQLSHELENSKQNLTRHEKSFQNILPKIQRDALDPEKLKNSYFKRWRLKRRMQALAKKNLQKAYPEKISEKQSETQDQLKKNLKNAEKWLALGLPSWQFAAREPTLGNTEQANPTGLLQQAQNIQNETAALYREARAAELALLQNRAYASTSQHLTAEEHFFADNVRYNPPDDVKSAHEIQALKKSFEIAAREMDLILADIEAMRQKAASTRTSVSDSGLTAVTVAMRRQASRQQTVEQLAGPQGRQAQDLSQEMFQLLNPGRTPTFGRGRDNRPPHLQLSMQHFGRKITSYGKPVDCFYIDSWYMIGPFPNSHRRHIDDMFPPETMIDLDAEYMGKHGPVSWEFCSSPTYFIKPIHYVEYGIYYAYTELYSELEQTVWMAFGSDDRLDVWINDIKVWQSSNQLKQWRPDEGFRKVYVKQGYNKILARLENGYRECGFSVFVALE
ncbi:hypothetical protein EH223_10090 [candidate division KSB1 bacterium]|nr:hypothetical protein [candidate division KSB1 bacterium]RQW03396.1 MAG: hypothetical protein EH223_10090 [candidate division KSB1 bacterium]